MGGWDRENEFKDLLARCAKKPSSNGMEKLVEIALADEKRCYKHVSGLLLKYAHKSKQTERINVLYCLSAILRKSKAKLGKKDLYVPRLGPEMVKFANLFADAPAQQMAQVAKVVSSWRKDDLFGADILAAYDKLADKAKGDRGQKPLPAHGSPITGGDSNISLPSAGSLEEDVLHHASRPAERDHGAEVHAEVSSQPWPSMHQNIVLPGQLPPPPPIPPLGMPGPNHIPPQAAHGSATKRPRKKTRWEEMPDSSSNSQPTSAAAPQGLAPGEAVLPAAHGTPQPSTPASAPPLPGPAGPPPPQPPAPAAPTNGQLQVSSEDADKQRRIAEILATSSRAAAEQSQSQPPTQPPPSWPTHPPHLQPPPPSQPPPSWGMPPPMHMPLAAPTLPPGAVQQGSWYQQPYIAPPAPHPMWPPPAGPGYPPQFDWHQGQWPQHPQQAVPALAPLPFPQTVPPPAPPRAPPPQHAEPVGPPPPPPPSPPPAPAGSPPAPAPKAQAVDVKPEPVDAEPKDNAAPGVDKGDGRGGAPGMADLKPPVNGALGQAGSIGGVGGPAVPTASDSKAGAPGFPGGGTSVSAVGTKEAVPLAAPQVVEGLGHESKAGDEAEPPGTTGDRDVKQGWVAHSNGLNGLGHEGRALGSSAPGFAVKTISALSADAQLDGMGKIQEGQNAPSVESQEGQPASDDVKMP